MTVPAPSPNGSNILMFRTGAGMPARLGSEQLKDEITAVIELVKNAYDADATLVAFKFRETDGGQSIHIQDDGSGMDLGDLHTKWAWLATENKIRDDRSPVYRRRRLGQKGVGRFAAQKLGRELKLRTRTSGAPDVLQVRFNWDELSGDRELGDYEFPIKHKKPEPLEPSHGTRLEMRPLRVVWNRTKIAKLRAQLAQLIDPEAGVSDFRIFLDTPWPELDGELLNPLHGKETHSLEFDIAADGGETVRLVRDGKPEVRREKLTEPPFGPLRGRLRYFGQGFKKSEVSRGGDIEADWNVGVRIFRDACRVRPYGEPGPAGDWLQIYLRRYLGGSRFRLKPHYLEGTIHIAKEANPDLTDTTSREGLELNVEYEALVEYAQSKVAQLSEWVREDEIKQERSRIHERYRRALGPLTSGLGQVTSEDYRKAVDKADREVRKTLKPNRFDTIVLNAHWECLDCGDSWKAPMELTPSHCRQNSVGRDGKPSNKVGCGSSNVRRKENVRRDEPGNERAIVALEDVMTGDQAYVSGMQLRPLIDWEMGENDEEAEVRPEKRELAINGRHAAFRVADRLDGNETVEGETLESLRAVAALTVHVVNAAAHAWGRWHYDLHGKVFDQYLSKTSELKAACLESAMARVG